MTDRLGQLIAGAAGLHDAIGEKLAGSSLLCRVCGHTQRPTHKELARYLRIGWPRHCGEVMSLDGDERATKGGSHERDRCPNARGRSMSLYMERRGDTPDYCAKEGAEAIAAAIAEYWAKRGHQVAVKLVDTGFHPAIRAARYDVRSDMKNGLPIGAGGLNL